MPDSSGEVRLDRDEDWELVVTRWASVEPLTGNELWRAQQVQADLTHEVVMRYVPDLTSRYRLKWGARRFQLRPPANPGEEGYTTYIKVPAVEVGV